jgi:hypothetical protein
LFVVIKTDKLIYNILQYFIFSINYE